MAQNKPAIKYATGRSFDSIKGLLDNYRRKYYSDVSRDASEAAFDSLMMDAVAYIGDQLSFYLDYQANESFMDSSIEPNNILRHGRSRGFKFSSHPSSYGIASLYLIVPANTNGIGPNLAYAPVLRKGSEVATAGNNGFILNEDVDFADPNLEAVVAKVDNSTGKPTSYVIKGFGQVISGEIRQQTFTIGGYERFLSLKIKDENVAEVLRIIDSESHEYFEVNYLSQDVVFRELINRDSLTSVDAPLIMKPFPVPRRFVVEQLKNETILQFGYGTADNIDANTLTDPSTVILNVHGKNYVTDQTFDPLQLIESDKFGIVPTNTDLTVSYRINSSQNVNVPVGGLNKVVRPLFEFANFNTLSTNLLNSTAGSLEVENENPIVGDVSFPSSDELKRRIIDFSATQNRAVTRQDYIAMAYAMPAKFGAIKRVNIVQDSDSFKRNLNMYVIAEDSAGNLIAANDQIKKNLKVWLNQHKMINDTIDVIDGKIANVGINFVAIGDNNFPSHLIRQRIIAALAEKYSMPPDIGEPFSYDAVYRTINDVAGVIDTSFVEIVRMQGDAYSDIRFNISKNTSPDGRLVEVPENVILEIKYPNLDIKGEVR